jgi:hypothetical protein
MPSKSQSTKEKLKRIGKKYVLPAVATAGALGTAYLLRDQIGNAGAQVLGRLQSALPNPMGPPEGLGDNWVDVPTGDDFLSIRTLGGRGLKQDAINFVKKHERPLKIAGATAVALPLLYGALTYPFIPVPMEGRGLGKKLAIAGGITASALTATAIGYLYGLDALGEVIQSLRN